MKIQVLYDELAHHQHLPQLQHQKTGFEYWPKSILIRNRPLGKENRESYGIQYTSSDESLLLLQIHITGPLTIKVHHLKPIWALWQRGMTPGTECKSDKSIDSKYNTSLSPPINQYTYSIKPPSPTTCMPPPASCTVFNNLLQYIAHPSLPAPHHQF